MPGPDPRGPTFTRRLITAAKVVVGASVLIGGLAAIQVWKFIKWTDSTAGGVVLVTGERESVPPTPTRRPPEPRVGATTEEAIAASAFVIVDLSTGRAIREQKSEWLDTPVWPGSIAKLATFAAAIDAGVLTGATRIICTRRLTLPELRRVDCSHPPLAHPLSPVEALANSCNIFTATIARGLTREQLSSGFVRLGLSPVPAGTDLITGAFGLGGAQVAPRKLIEAVRRAANIPLLRDGLHASATTGTSSAFAAAGIEALAKTGTAPMRGGRALGLVTAITPAASPRLGIVVALPGGSGAQAAETAAAILRSLSSSATASSRHLPDKSDVQGAETATAILRSLTPIGTSGTQGTRSTSGADDLRLRREDGAALARASATEGAIRLRGGRVLWSRVAGGNDAAEQRESSRQAAAPSAAAAVRIGQPTAKGYAVESLDVEEYVARVVAGETSDATPAAAREALAITARTFAMVNRGRHASDGFDLCTLTHCQVTRPATRSSRAATDRTRGEVLVVDDAGARDARDARGARGAGDVRDDRDGRSTRVAPVFYSASCGGTLADARTLLADADSANVPWLASRPDPAGIEEVAWQTDISADDLLRALQQSGSRGDTLRNLIAHASAAGNAGAALIGGSAEDRRTPTPSTPANLGRRRATQSDGASGSNAGVGSSGTRGTSGSSGRPALGAGTGPGFVTHVTTEGLTPSTLAFDDFRRAVGQQIGWQLLKSARFTVQRTSRGYRFTGRGHGHGVGLCVLGASALAARGADASRIIEAYFPGLRIAAAGSRTLAPASQSTRSATTTGASAAGTSRTAPMAADAGAAGAPAGRAEAANAGVAAAIQLRLPSSDESERARLLRLIATNLKELALDLSLPSPSGLDVVVHPTVDAYRRATRSPSWTSAATILSGDDITLHFAPLSVLDRGAMLTRTVRHELVHVLTLRALFDRPRWVHEGLALHFAGERVSAEPEETSRDDVKCPSDRDLMRPRSRDAFDRAYSRAAACVARDLAAGRNWRDLGAR